MSDVLFENDGWDKDRMAELARAVLSGSRWNEARWNEAPELAALALRAVNELGRLRRERDEAVARAAAAEADAKLWREATATLPLTAEALGKVAFTSLHRPDQYSADVRERWETLAVGVARAVMAALSSGAAAKAAWDANAFGQSDWWSSKLEAAAKAALALPEMVTPQQTEAPTRYECSSCGKGCLHAKETSPLVLRCCECGARWRDEVDVALEAQEQVAPPPPQTEAPPLKWDGDVWFHTLHSGRHLLDPTGRRELDLRRQVEALDARLRKLEGSR